MTERSQHQIPPTAHTQTKRKTKKKRKSQEHGPLANNALTTISPQTTPQHTSTQLCFRHRASVSFPQQMLPSSARWPRNTPENKTGKYFSSKNTPPTKTPNYIIQETDYKNYSVVFSCTQLEALNLQFAWILTRVRGLAPPNLAQLESKLTAAGVDVTEFFVVDQKGCPGK
ncbi:prostaglandin-h2 d-isomerase [Plakobranchus ocellatus]|uniref:Prostaglandin-h2 d-isomerase n=1 Tax=Plakobranchus ocellatus TaxID=259542 RepID=A0AAV4CKG1_9GAST|nr:prostaglandin-h2 d-isomerase [Plakobranchus ocellatus]